MFIGHFGVAFGAKKVTPAVAWSAQIIWVLVILAFWVDYNRVRKQA
jgi:hypothetical protein